MASKTKRLNLRLTSAQDAVLRSAAEARGESASEYVLRHAVEAAEIDLADRRVFVVDDAAWQELQALISAPASLPLSIAKLLANPTVLEGPGR
ncbi:MAG: type II toxin-antitoxin system TacA family antitoxin [Acidimicrobiales bacterium]